MEKYFEQLAKIYNTLLMVGTKGEDTIVMGQCLAALRDLLMHAQEELSESSGEPVTE